MLGGVKSNCLFRALQIKQVAAIWLRVRTQCDVNTAWSSRVIEKKIVSSLAHENDLDKNASLGIKHVRERPNPIFINLTASKMNKILKRVQLLPKWICVTFIFLRWRRTQFPIAHPPLSYLLPASAMIRRFAEHQVTPCWLGSHVWKMPNGMLA